MSGGVAVAVWLLVAVVLVLAELLTLAFVALYLAVGAAGAAIAAAFGANLGMQLAVFGVVSVASLLLTRRPLRRVLGRTPTVVSNAPTVVGKRAVVTRPILEGPGQRGQVRVGTEEWTARGESENAIAEGAKVEVVAIDGVSLVVRPVVTGADPIQS
jgi:membrane protein implicated in regulation of membrane protease activity